MKSSAAPGLGIALLLLFLAAAPALAAGNGAKAKVPGPGAKGSAPSEQSKLQETPEQTRKNLETLFRRVPSVGLQTRWMKQVLGNQVRLAARLWNLKIGLAITLGLLGALALWALWQGRRRHGALLALREEMRELRSQIEAWQTAQSLTVAPQGDPPPAVVPRIPRQEERAGLPPVEDAEEDLPAIPAELPHRAVALLLARLRRAVPQLAARFGDPALGERFRGELDAPLRARLDRLLVTAVKGEEELRARWLGPDLVTTLDALASFYSEAIEEERRGRAAGDGLSKDLRVWLYDSFGRACRDEGWFAIESIDPYITRFDPRIHHALTGRNAAGAEGKILAVKAIGRRDPKNGTIVHKAEVIVGR